MMKFKTIEKTWSEFNVNIFNNVLTRPTFRDTRNWRYYGHVVTTGNSGKETMTINLNSTYDEIVETIYHEMIHQLVDGLGIEEDDQHGPIFVSFYNAFRPTGWGEYSEIEYEKD